MTTLEQYLRSHAVTDGKGNMDGEFVPLSVALLGAEQAIQNKLELVPPSNVKFESKDMPSYYTHEGRLVECLNTLFFLIDNIEHDKWKDLVNNILMPKIKPPHDNKDDLVNEVTLRVCTYLRNKFAGKEIV